jgi:type IV pilus assembly protein PilM
MPLGPLRKLTSLAGMLGQAPPAIAVDFGVASLKVLQIEKQEQGASLVAAGCVETPEALRHDPVARLSMQAKALGQLVRQCGFKGRRAVVAIPAGQTFVKHVQVPRSEGLSPAPLVEQALAAQLRCEASSLQFRHVDLGSIGGGKSEVIGMAVPRDLVGRLMEAVKTARLDPVGMHSEFHAALRTFDSVTRRDTDHKLTSLYLDVGAGSTKVLIAHGQSMVFARVIDVGGAQLDAALAAREHCDATEARARRVRRGDAGAASRAPEPALASAVAGSASAGALRAAVSPHGVKSNDPLLATADRRVGLTPAGLSAVSTDEPATDLGEPLEILVEEVQHCVRYHESAFPGRRPDRVVFVGGEARDGALCAALARSLRITAQVWDPLARLARTGSEPCVGVDLRKSQPGWAVALGLCLCPTDL